MPESVYTAQFQEQQRLATDASRYSPWLGVYQSGSFTILPINDTVSPLVSGFQNAGDLVPIRYNPSAELTKWGLSSYLLSGSSSECSAGCVQVHPDPRNPTVKPLYKATQSIVPANIRAISSQY